MHHQEEVGPEELTSHQHLAGQFKSSKGPGDEKKRRNVPGYGSGGEQLKMIIISLITFYYSVFLFINLAIYVPGFPL
ncbi:hypothetical protein B9Z55_008189 [Caenorhabditis nigoni]|uniref:Uncharacterized protein n=1 Tax=Caenorhabditis nigoni TaxID=1611254 RepID=A0A2G5VD29_9PELO|nr:hypothetical protein B9Z55_008189 [Caenorhabditis nigoni]